MRMYTRLIFANACAMLGVGIPALAHESCTFPSNDEYKGLVFQDISESIRQAGGNPDDRVALLRSVVRGNDDVQVFQAASDAVLRLGALPAEDQTLFVLKRVASETRPNIFQEPLRYFAIAIVAKLGDCAWVELAIAQMNALSRGLNVQNTVVASRRLDLAARLATELGSAGYPDGVAILERALNEAIQDPEGKGLVSAVRRIQEVQRTERISKDVKERLAERLSTIPAAKKSILERYSSFLKK